jgi:hypothetical protein|tara:strand:+ start:3419 stop:3892 length:474 start_codon:yes stop_codon:yes gene_type:complete
MVYEHSNIYDTFDDFSQYGGDDTKSFEGFVYGGENNNDDKRKFTVFEVDDKSVDLGDGGRYTVTRKASPSDAARKAFSALCRKLKKSHFTFSIRETTQGSKKKVYGPYIGNRKRLSKPKVYHRTVKGKKKTITIKHEHKVKLHKKQQAKLGGGVYYA